MNEILGSIWWLLVALGVLITFHEFGHFWVARRLGVRVLRFSIGFGRPVWSRTGADGVQYVIAVLPLGGYVKMLDEREGDVPDNQLHEAFNRKPVLDRAAIVVAGPAFNLIFTILAFWVMFMLGIPESRPVIGEVSGIAEAAGLQAGDEIVAIDQQETRTWTHAVLGLVPHAIDREPVQITVRDSGGNESSHELDLSRLEDGFSEENTLEAIGLTPWRLNIPAVVGTVSPDSPAAGAGIYPGDRIVRVNGEEVPGWSWVGYLVQKYGGEEQFLTLTIDREGTQLEVKVKPRKESSGIFSSHLLLGISNAEPGPDQRTA
ncbi:MAG: RIP metalloprotease RseP, partial [Xanthomonadales bacterium]|nr:RIP metalloprotease RseP [Xanthomonadales bacterium]